MNKRKIGKIVVVWLLALGILLQGIPGAAAETQADATVAASGIARADATVVASGIAQTDTTAGAGAAAQADTTAGAGVAAQTDTTATAANAAARADTTASQGAGGNRQETVYKITYKLKGGKNNKANPSSYTPSSTVKLKNPTRKGYTFAGWYLDAKYKKKITAIRKGSTGNKTLYAKWTKKKYAIRYVLNKGTNNKKNPSSYTGKAAVKLKKPKRKGYTFQGWYADAKFKKRVVSIAKGSSGNKTLYAKWKANSYKISFSANGGTGETAGISCKYGKTYKLPLSGFVRTNYHMKEWNTKADGSGKSYAVGASVENLAAKSGRTVKLYAIWEKYTATELKLANEVVRLVNVERKKQGLDTLSANSLLSAVAQERAYETILFWDHQRPDGSMCFTLFKSAGYRYWFCGENIAVGQTSPSVVVDAWMNSEKHRENILGDFKQIGVGCIRYNGYYYWVQCFGVPW